MAYSAPSVRVYGELINPAAWNQLVNNQLHFASPPLARTVFLNTTNIDTNSTAFVDASTTNLSLSLNTERGNRVYAEAAFVGLTTAVAPVHFDLALDGTRASPWPNGLAQVDGSTDGHLTIFGVWTGVPVGAHVVRLQFKTSDISANARITLGPVSMKAWE
ncbi:hypothetical protein G4Y79_20920 [Phototrophicus methaneseepsis]|uniref:Uncharacterized protein n=1 Tax=Phototrophicus methaneseepsis TaxID=2710758 RepID=A0A7S8E835_9CHLR|nr:hypothetical protein [Phototrophicus methaneseepsis]QPC82120.1 hypothetical protein G4Y79_20920 [Phototrophicus methaneseepsis]